ncbi:putative transmembrane protein [Gregarina niphandrodes]|uniref:Transmembrane protein n=1 Tax=Gregarina niphandrodes TaxID=110365 RepID=A0A023AXP5_GRENI|nr:putative transmembrane protein [Gregarina niphandrodes]EZG43416.1 putative transmembrane protein [Gregarina niphandrodes]|eukprot:XP_011133357.1 putative transmembrane protein [Gregarina niphandrodes]
MWWALVLLSTAALLYFLFATTTKVLMMLQMKLGLFNVKKALQTREPNLVVGAGYGCVLVLEDPLLRQLPSVMISPNVIDYATKLPQAEAKQLNLEDSPFVYVTYDTSQSPTTIKESVLLADTAEPGLSATDWLCVRFADERKLTTILEYSFSKGWTNIAEREGCRLELDPNDNLVRVLVDDDLCSKLFFKAVPSGATSTPWLTQNELQLILTLHDSAI